MGSHCATRVSLVLIVRNEAVGIRSIVPQLRRDVFDDCFAVDGCSSDETVALLEAADIPVYRQQAKGLGAAMLEARQKVRTEAFVFFHPDGNEDPGDLARMAALLREGRQFVVASRMVRGAVNEEDDQFLKPRKWANNGFALLANLLFGHGGNRTSDVTNGFRGIRCEAWDRMNLSSRDLTMDYQMVIRALKLGIPITEFATREGQRLDGATNFASFSTGVAELRLLWREIRLGLRSVGAADAPESQIPAVEPEGNRGREVEKDVEEVAHA